MDRLNVGKNDGVLRRAMSGDFEAPVNQVLEVQ